MTRFVFYVIRIDGAHKWGDEWRSDIHPRQEMTVTCEDEAEARRMLENTPGIYDVTLVTKEAV